jgi:mono/diheme cytochrome c family protein
MRIVVGVAVLVATVLTGCGQAGRAVTSGPTGESVAAPAPSSPTSESVASTAPQAPPSEPVASATQEAPTSESTVAPSTAGSAPAASTVATSDPAPSTAAAGAGSGKEIFLSAGCAGCHTLADAGASGTVGPNLDDESPDAEKVAKKMREGGGGMPSFAGSLSDAEIQQVAEYVASVAGGGGGDG